MSKKLPTVYRNGQTKTNRILELTAEGLTLQQIALRLGTTVKSVGSLKRQFLRMEKKRCQAPPQDAL